MMKSRKYWNLLSQFGDTDDRKIAKEMSDTLLEDVNKLVDNIAFQDPAAQAYYDELKSKLKALQL